MVAFWPNFVYLLQLSTTPLTTNHSTFIPSLCLSSSSTLGELVTCFEYFTVPPNHYNTTTYLAAQPTSQERDDWRILITTFLDFLSAYAYCTSAIIPDSLKQFYAIERFHDTCVLYEASVEGGVYTKGWGFMIVPLGRTLVSRTVHFSAPHPVHEPGTVQQAAFLFQSTGSQSLFVAGRHRDAFSDFTKCNGPQKYNETDPTHNDLEPFFDANLAISYWQDHIHGCLPSSCGYIQIHGKKDTTCSDDYTFMSAGLGNSFASKKWYWDFPHLPIKRLQQNLRVSLPSKAISLPPDSSCFLTATRNVFGRYLNGVYSGSVCSKAATSKTARGMFLHVEQSPEALDPRDYNAWSQAMLNTFDVTCADGMVIDPATKLCRSKRFRFIREIGETVQHFFSRIRTTFATVHGIY